MAGHSKWANIKFRKGAQDAKRGKIFTKLIREITIAARMGGGDLTSNPRLRLVIDKARAQSLPKDNIERAIKRGTGDLDGQNYEQARYEGYGPGGVAVMVDCLTDNRNRTVGEVRHAFTKHGGNLGADGSVAYQFAHQGSLSYAPGADEDRIMEAALDAGAEDIVTASDSSIEVLTAPGNFESVRDAMTKAKLPPEHAELTMRASVRVPVEGETAESLVKLIDVLEDLDDVQQVYTNADIAAAAFEATA